MRTSADRLMDLVLGVTSLVAGGLVALLGALVFVLGLFALPLGSIGLDKAGMHGGIVAAVLMLIFGGGGFFAGFYGARYGYRLLRSDGGHLERPSE